MNLKIYKDANFYAESTAEKIGLKPLLNKGLEENKTFYTDSIFGYLKNKNFSVLDYLKDYKFAEVYNESFDEFAFANSDSVLSFSINDNNGHLSLNIVTLDLKLFEKVRSIADLCKNQLEKTGQVFCIVQNGPSLGLNSIGLAGIDFNANNYSKCVVNDYNYVVKDLLSKTPAGRVALFEGIPGSR